MEITIRRLLPCLTDQAMLDADVIAWGAPIPAFGNPAQARIATLGLNPSNREFVDASGRELDGDYRRFHTLRSLGLRSWKLADRSHVRAIQQSCIAYFANNPYEGWFRRLESIICGSGYSYYANRHHACHLDLVPFATTSKWTELSASQRQKLIEAGASTLASVLQTSPIRVLVANGRGAIEGLQAAAGAKFSATRMRDWDLQRASGMHVHGFAVQGAISELAGIRLKKEVGVIGFNHNIQSSFGVTTKVKAAIGDWVADACSKGLR